MSTRRPARKCYEGEEGQSRRVAVPVQSGVVGMLAIGLMLFGTGSAPAVDFNCPGGDVICLIDAINDANGTVAADTIILAAGTFNLTAVDNNTDGHNGLPSITTDITIQGAGALTTTILRAPPSAPAFRIFHVAAAGKLTLNALTIAEGFVDGENGAGILNAGGDLTIIDSVIKGHLATNFALHPSFGAGVFNDTGGNLTITNSTVIDNTCNGPHGSAGLFNKGVAGIDNSSISQNAGFDCTGGIRNSGVMALTNSTVGTNFMFEGASAILNEGGGTLSINNGTVAENQTTAFSTGGIVNLSGTVELRNTILAGNHETSPEFSNCSGTITSSGNNVIGASLDGCVINDVPSDIRDIDVGIVDPFSDDGSPGNYHFPLATDSPAIDAGNAADPGSGGDACEATDQLGTPRPIDGDCDGDPICDIGAIEFVPSVENVDTELTGTPDPSSFTFDPAPVPEGPAGTFTFTAEFCNVGVESLTCIRSTTTTLTGGNALVNRNTSTPASVGSELSFQLTGDYADGILSPGECVEVTYVIGLAAKAPFQFFVSVLGAAD